MFSIFTLWSSMVNLYSQLDFLDCDFTDLEGISNREQNQASNEQVLMTGEKGRYTAKIMVNAPIETVWEVLTDYDNFKNFLPNFVSSQVLESNGDRKIYEQTNIIEFPLFRYTNRATIEVRQFYPKQVNFHIVAGNIKTMEGYWQLEQRGGDRLVMLTNQSNVESDLFLLKEFFYTMYKISLIQTLQAIKQEAQIRFRGCR
jgi:ribosome-associated toxin RatA of RatAB toxin-antitoxin module